MHARDRPRPTVPLRLLLLALLALAASAALLALLFATDAALSIVERLRGASPWLIAAIAVPFVLTLGLFGAVGWRLWRGPPVRRRDVPIGREQVEARLAQLETRGAGAGTAQRRELLEADRRAASGEVYVALFGAISSGKSSLLRALSGRDDLAVDVRGGTTRAVTLAHVALDDDRELVVADLPGLHEPGDRERAAMARAEVMRAHAVVYLCDGDLTRDQHAELEHLLALGKPTVLALNKTDRYDRAELAELGARLRAHLHGRALLVTVCAGGRETLQRETGDGRHELVERERASETAALLRALAQLTAGGAAALEPARQRALLEQLDRQLAAAEAELRSADAAVIVRRYTRRAVVGALAAVAPGTDLLIQGALATALLRELTRLYGIGLRDVDADRFIARAGGTVRTGTSITLAIAGNALKAFPGFGTIGGGLVHAVAYGLVFDALGRAVAATLAERAALDVDAAMARLDAELRAPESGRLETMARLALEHLRDDSPRA
jgi:hypothetical protein